MRARRNTSVAAAYDLKVFFAVVGKDPLDVKTAIPNFNHSPSCLQPLALVSVLVAP